MSEWETQGFWVPSGATLRLPPRMRLARAELERLWKGLERFVNCGDSESDYQALGRAFPDFWPVDIWHYPNLTSLYPPVLGRVTIRKGAKGELIEAEIKQMEWESQTESLNWHPTCHKLFLFYRDSLREVWRGERQAARSDRPDMGFLSDLLHVSPLGWVGGFCHEFLLGLRGHNGEARREKGVGFSFTRPVALDFAWKEILRQFPTAASEGRVEISMLWEMGDFFLRPRNDFQRAFYLLFRQNWRARLCARCRMFFVARKPKQIFCGTACSAGNRLASKRKWWKRVGAKQRAAQSKARSRRNRAERKQK